MQLSPVRYRRPLVPAVILTISALLGGCARWHDDDPNPLSALPAVRESPKAVVLNVEFAPVSIDPESLDEAASLWQWVDETVVESGARQRLSANGLRVGRLINTDRFAARVNHLRPKQDVVDQFLAEASIASEVSVGGKRIPMRFGRRYELNLRQPMEGEQVTLLRLDDETVGRTLSDPQFLFAVVPTSGNAPGTVDLRFRPEIQFGETKPKWVSSDSALRIDSRRDTWSIQELDLMLRGKEGDTFVIAGSNPLSGLAEQMLSGTTADHSPQQLIVLVRIEKIPDAIDQL